VLDPADLTPKVRSLGEHAAATSDLDLAGIEAEFVEAAKNCIGNFSEAVFDTVGARKAEIGIALLAPGVLRAAMYFNAVAWSEAFLGENVESIECASGDEVRDVQPLAPPANEFASDDSVGGPATAELSQVAPRAAEPVADVSEVQWRIEPQPAVHLTPRSDREPSSRRPAIRRAAAVVGLVALVLAAAQLGWFEARGSVRILSDVDLRAISSQLDSGYRGGFGTGSLFVGTVGTAWQNLSRAERERSAEQIVTRLEGAGLREILVYDERRRIALHFAEGLPLRIGP
jgi:hypothetical protein